MAAAAGAAGARWCELKVPQLAENTSVLAWPCSLSARASSPGPLPHVPICSLCPLPPYHNSPSPQDCEPSTDQTDCAQHWPWDLEVADPVSHPRTLHPVRPVPGRPALSHLQGNRMPGQHDEGFRGSHGNQKGQWVSWACCETEAATLGSLKMRWKQEGSLLLTAVSKAGRVPGKGGRRGSWCRQWCEVGTLPHRPVCATPPRRSQQMSDDQGGPSKACLSVYGKLTSKSQTQGKYLLNHYKHITCSGHTKRWCQSASHQK